MGTVKTEVSLYSLILVFAHGSQNDVTPRSPWSQILVPSSQAVKLSLRRKSNVLRCLSFDVFLLFLFVCIPVDKLKFTLKRGQVKERKDKDTEDGKEDDKTDFYLFDVKTRATDHLKNNLF